MPLSPADVKRDLADISHQSQPHAALAVSSRQTPDCEGMAFAESKAPLQDQHKSNSRADIIRPQQGMVAVQVMFSVSLVLRALACLWDSV